MNGPDVPDLPERRDLTWIEGSRSRRWSRRSSCSASTRARCACAAATRAAPPAHRRRRHRCRSSACRRPSLTCPTFRLRGRPAGVHRRAACRCCAVRRPVLPGDGTARRAVAIAIAILGLLAAGAHAGGAVSARLSSRSAARSSRAASRSSFSEIVIVATIATLLLSLGIGRDDQVAGTTSLVLWSAAGAMLMAGAANLMSVFLGLELLSLGLYCLCAISRARRRASRRSST